MLKRAKHMACILTDPTSKKDSFYCTIRRHVKKYGEQHGLQLEIRKTTLSPWVEEYLFDVFKLQLNIKEEKALISNLRIVDYIMKEKIPDFVAIFLSKQHECGETCVCTSRPYFLTKGKVPRRGGYGN